MVSEDQTPFDRARNFALAKLYFDANSFIAGAFETLPEVRAHINYRDSMATLPDDAARLDRTKREDAMAIILSRWNPELAFVSPHALLEVLDVATRRYEIPPENAIEILSAGIQRDFTLLPAEFDIVRSGTDVIKKLEERIPQAWQYARIRYRAMARDAEGHPLGSVSFGEDLTSGVGRVSSKSGSPATFEAMKSLDAPQSHTISAPKFERELFLGAAQLSMEHGIHAADALHILLCAGKGMVIVTSDKKMLKKFPRMSAALPHAQDPIEVLGAWGHALDPAWPP